MQIVFRLFLAVFIASWSSILVRWIGDLHPLIIAFYRLFLSALLLLIYTNKRLIPTLILAKQYVWYIVFAGLFLAVHFYTWITSLQLTTVGNSIFLESTHPVFALILSFIFLKEKISVKIIPAFLLSLLGMYLTVSIDLGVDAEALLGDFLAILAAIAIAAYLLFARTLRTRFPLIPYLIYVYFTASAIIFIVILIQNINFISISASQWFFLFLLAIGPNLIGHSLLNWSAQRIPVYKVNMALLGESILATVFAALLLDEYPHLQFYFGAGLILCGIIMVFWIEQRLTKQE
ncbi:MAG: EamA family transporter [Caldithrix sp.]|nr:EamA family transporter [Caldithrix sp.]